MSVRYRNSERFEIVSSKRIWDLKEEEKLPYNCFVSNSHEQNLYSKEDKLKHDSLRLIKVFFLGDQLFHLLINEMKLFLIVFLSVSEYNYKLKVFKCKLVRNEHLRPNLFFFEIFQRIKDLLHFKFYF